MTAMATLAGAPPGALRNPGDSARETPDSVGTKSMSISPKLTMRPFSLVEDIGTRWSLCFRDQRKNDREDEK